MACLQMMELKHGFNFSPEMDESSTFLREKENIFPLERKLQMGQLNLLWIVAAAILNGLMARKKIPLFACFKTGG